MTHEEEGCATDDGRTEKSFSRGFCTSHLRRADNFCAPQNHSQMMSVLRVGGQATHKNCLTARTSRVASPRWRASACAPGGSGASRRRRHLARRAGACDIASEAGRPEGLLGRPPAGALAQRDARRRAQAAIILRRPARRATASPVKYFRPF